MPYDANDKPEKGKISGNKYFQKIVDMEIPEISESVPDIPMLAPGFNDPVEPLQINEQDKMQLPWIRLRPGDHLCRDGPGRIRENIGGGRLFLDKETERH
ncbi:MAG: hypothetical protein CSB33_02325 [Desulfobacterales bacterium]|nr:MAG: hypothetical protein CSB33_02325 [Desulfobacterales bacterium]